MDVILITRLLTPASHSLSSFLRPCQPAGKTVSAALPCGWPPSGPQSFPFLGPSGILSPLPRAGRAPSPQTGAHRNSPLSGSPPPFSLKHRPSLFFFIPRLVCAHGKLRVCVLGSRCLSRETGSPRTSQGRAVSAAVPSVFPACSAVQCLVPMGTPRTLVEGCAVVPTIREYE